jgi:hypothetical protein
MKHLVIYCFWGALILGGSLFAGNFEEQTSLNLTLPETGLIVKDIPTHNKNAASAHLRAQLEQVFAHIKHDFIDNAVENYGEYIVQPQPTPIVNSSSLTVGCRTAYDQHGEVIGCYLGEPHDCTCVIVIGKKVFNSAGQLE